MSQNVVNYGIDPSGAQLLDELLSGEQQNRLTMDGGNSRPPYAEIGTIWTDKSVTGKATLKRFNGTSDDVLMTVDETTGAITIPGFADTDLSNLSASGNSKFQAPLESGINIKTVNNESLLGSGDITISAGADVDLSNLSATGEAHFQEPLASGTNIKTLNNVSLLGSGNISTGDSVTSKWRSGYNWYRKWSDGWIEQGGRKVLGTTRPITLSFNTAFTTTEYSLAISNTCTAVSSASYATEVYSPSTTGITVYYNYGGNAVSADAAIYWYACGY